MHGPVCKLLALAMAAGALSTTLTAGTARADEWVTTKGVRLPISSITDTEVDPRGVLWVAGPQGLVSVNGQEVTRVAGTEQGVLDLDTSGDHLVAALRGEGTGSIMRIDLIDRSTRTWTLPEGSCPHDVALVEGQVWYSSDLQCDVVPDLHALDPMTGNVRRVYGEDGPVYDAELDAVAPPGAPARILVSRPYENSALLLDGDGNVLARPEVPRPIAADPASGRVFVQHPGRSSIDVHRSSDFAVVDTFEVTDPGPIGLAPHSDVAGSVLAIPQGATVSLLSTATRTVLNRIEIEDALAPSAVRLVGERALIAAPMSGGGVHVFDVGAAVDPAPVLTAAFAEPVEAGVATTLAGHLRKDGSGVQDSTVTVTDLTRDVVLGTALTQADGTWSLPLTFATPGHRYLRIESTPRPGHKAAVTRVSVRVVKEESSLTLEAPSSAAPSEELTFSGELRRRSAAVPGVTVSWRAWCPADYRVSATTGTVRTDADGRFSFVHRPAPCAEARVDVGWAGDAVTQAAYAESIVVVRWQPTTVSADLPERAYINDTLRFSVAVAVAGRPATAGVPVEISVWDFAGRETTQTRSTGSDGVTAPFEIPLASQGPHSFRIATPTEGDVLGAFEARSVWAEEVRSGIDLEVTTADPVAGEAVEVHGAFRSGDGRVSDVPLSLVVLSPDPEAPRTSHTVRTAPDGTFTVRFDAAAFGVWGVGATYAGHAPRYAGSETSIGVDVRPRRSRLELSTVGGGYRSGDQIPVTGRLLREDGRPMVQERVLLTAGDSWRHPDRHERTSVLTDADGGFSWTPPAAHADAGDTVWVFAARHAGTAVDGPSEARLEVPVPYRDGRITLKSGASRPGTGDPVVLTGVLTDDEGVPESAPITLARTDPDGLRTEIDEVRSDAATGAFSFTDTPPGPGTYVYDVVSTNADVISQEAHLEVRVGAVSLTSELSRPSPGGWATYRLRADPVLATRLSPAEGGLCVRHRVERLRQGTWRTLRLGRACLTTSHAGAVRLPLDVRRGLGSRFRVRAVFEGDADRLGAAGPWRRFRFRSP